MMLEDIKKETVPVQSRWGERMPLMACEECGELIQAISKLERKLHAKKSYDHEYQNLVEEIGDLFITVGALMNRYCITPEEINKAMDDKLNEDREW